jgi:flagellar basal body-associated protein FliL
MRHGRTMVTMNKQNERLSCWLKITLSLLCVAIFVISVIRLNVECDVRYDQDYRFAISYFYSVAIFTFNFIPLVVYIYVAVQIYRYMVYQRDQH